MPDSRSEPRQSEITVTVKPASDRPQMWWSVRIDGTEHGGGWAKSESMALRDATNYVKDLGR